MQITTLLTGGNRSVRCLVFLLVLVSIYSPDLSAQCASTVTLSTQEEVDNFDCITVQGDLIIEGDGITEIGNFSGLEEVTGSFIIRNNPNLESVGNVSGLGEVGGSFLVQNNAKLGPLSGFSGLAEVGEDFTISDNPQLGDQNALAFSGLNEIGGNLTIRDNMSLIGIGDFSSLGEVGGDLLVENNDGATSGANLSTLSDVGGNIVVRDNEQLGTGLNLSNLIRFDGNIVYRDNPALSDLGNLSGLRSLEGELRIENNAELKTVGNLSSLIELTGGLYVSDNPAIEVFGNFSNLTELEGDLSIVNNDALTNVEGLATVESVGGDFTLEGNDMLSDCCDIVRLTETTDGSVTVSNNSAPCVGIQELQEACEFADQCFSDLKLTTQRQVDNFRCEVVQGNLTVSGDDITELLTFSGLKRIEGDFIIEDAGELVDLGNFSGLTEIQGDFIVRDNPKLETFGNFSGLGSVEGELTIAENPKLNGDINFSGVSTIGRQYNLQENDQFNGIVNLSNLTSVNGIKIFFNPRLKNAGSFGSLVSLDGNLRLQDNNRLTNNGDFSSVQTVNGSIDIINNDDLVSIQNFSSLQDVTGDVTISGNAELQSLGALDNFTNDGESKSFRFGSFDFAGFFSRFFGGRDRSSSISISINNNPKLTDIDGLSQLRRVNNLDVSNNASLNDCCALVFLISVAEGDLNIFGNQSSCADPVIAVASCNRKYGRRRGKDGLSDAYVHMKAEAGQLKVFPNPVSTTLGISVSEDLTAGNYRLRVFATDGRLSIDRQVSLRASDIITLDAGVLEPALYVLRLENDAGDVYTRRFLKQ